MARKKQSAPRPPGPSSDPTDRTDPTDRSDRSLDRTDRTAQLAADVNDTAQVLWSVLRSPLFAYALAALLAVPAFAYFASLWPEPEAAAPAAEAARDAASGARVEMAEIPAAPLEPRGRALLLLERYAQALRDRDIRDLREYWEMTPEQKAAIEEMFRDARIVSPLVDLQNLEVLDEDHMRIAFAEVLTLVRGAGTFYARGPTVYRALVERAPGFDAWRMTDREEVPPAGQAAPIERDSAR